MTSQNFSPATSDGTGADRPRRSRGGRGRGGRPAGDQSNQNQNRPAPAAVPALPLLLRSSVTDTTPAPCVTLATK